MKSLHELVYEKLHLNKYTNVGRPLKIEQIDSTTEHNIHIAMQQKSPREQASHMLKMEGYMKKGSDPKRLIATIKDNKKLFNRWFAAVKLEWDDAIILFGEAVADRCGFTQEQLHGYILKLYNNLKNSRYTELRDKYKHYLDLYNIEYE